MTCEALLLWAVFPLNPLDPPSQLSTRDVTLLPSVPEQLLGREGWHLDGQWVVQLYHCR